MCLCVGMNLEHRLQSCLGSIIAITVSVPLHIPRHENEWYQPTDGVGAVKLERGIQSQLSHSCVRLFLQPFSSQARPQSQHILLQKGLLAGGSSQMVLTQGNPCSVILHLQLQLEFLPIAEASSVPWSWRVLAALLMGLTINA